MNPHATIRRIAARWVLLATITAAMMARAQAAPLRLVKVQAPDVHCKFAADCSPTVKDFSDTFTLGAARGEGILQSRTLAVGEPRTAGAGLYCYEYRIDLREVAGLLAVPCVHTLSIEFGPVSSLDYDGDRILDDVFVVARGGLGSVAPSEAELTRNTITFHFSPAVCAGSYAGGGESTFFFGLASENEPGPVSAHVEDTLGGMAELKARGPSLPAASVPFLRGDTNLSGAAEIGDAVFLLQYLFVGGRAPACKAAADTNADGKLEMADAIALLGHLFLGSQRPAAPYPTCAVDPRPSALGCARYIPCLPPPCPDPAAQAIEFTIVSRSGKFSGDVRITGRMENIGGPFDSSPGQQSLQLYQQHLGAQAVLVAQRSFEDLGAGDTLEVSYTRSWDASSPSEGEFPPKYILIISYDPDIYMDGNEGNDDCGDNNKLERSGSDINALFP